VRQLELPDRLALLDLLLQLDAGPQEEHYDETWDAELQRRITQIDSGAVALVDADQALSLIQTLDS
jgi:hypothetical protein